MNNSIEGLFQKTLEGQRVSPSPKVLKNIKRKLFVSDFFSLNLRKFNVVYVSVVVIGVVLFPSLLNQKPDTIGEEFNVEELDNTNSERNILAFEPSEEQGEEQELFSEVNKGELTLKAFYIPDATKGCAPLSVNFQNKSINAKSYSWDFGNGNKSNKSNPEYIYNTPGDYLVKLVTTDKKGESAEYIQTIHVYEVPISDFEISITESSLDTKEIVFNNTSEKAVKYKWSFGDNTKSVKKEPKHVYTSFGTYKVELVAISENGCSDTLSLTNNFIDKEYRLVFPLQFKPSLIGSNKGAYERPENQAFVFYPQNNGVIEYSLAISASNGIEVFQTNDIKHGWDGYIRGRIAPAGTYKYKAAGVYPNGKSFIFTGNVKLVIDNNYQNFNNN